MKIQRTRLLVFLCLMTFVFSGYNLFTNVMQVVNGMNVPINEMAKVEQLKDSLQSDLEEDPAIAEDLLFRYKTSEIEAFTRIYQNPRPFLVVSALGALLCIGGAMFMFFSLDMKGWYLYILGSAVDVGGSLFLLGDLLFGQFWNSLMGILLIGIVLLYRKGLKDSIELTRLQGNG